MCGKYCTVCTRFEYLMMLEIKIFYLFTFNFLHLPLYKSTSLYRTGNLLINSEKCINKLEWKTQKPLLFGFVQLLDFIYLILLFAVFM